MQVVDIQVVQGSADVPGLHLDDVDDRCPGAQPRVRTVHEEQIRVAVDRRRVVSPLAVAPVIGEPEAAATEDPLGDGQLRDVKASAHDQYVDGVKSPVDANTL